jgi:hypothetical protein
VSDINLDLLEACRAGLRALEEIGWDYEIYYAADMTMLREAIARAEALRTEVVE